jgi:parallel beta-helix repeat protein
MHCLLGWHIGTTAHTLQNNFDSNGGPGILLNGGAMVLAEGNTIEGNGGPAIVANGIRAL